MASSLFSIFALCILNSILFYDKNLGINVILFMVPLIGFLYYTLKNKKKIKNKYGLLFIIPIVLLSCTYFIYDIQVFRVLNALTIPILFLFLYIFTIKPTYSLKTIVKDCLYFIFEPLNYIGKFYRVVNLKLDSLSEKMKLNKRIVKSFVVVIPIVIVVILLLSSADMVFHNLFSDLFRLFKNISLGNIIGRIFFIFLLFTYLGAVVNYLLFGINKEKDEEKKKSIDDFTIKLLLSALNVIYIIFDFIQIKSLIFHSISMNISYAEYAREGFFQLMIISLINLVILLLSKRSKENKYNKIMSIVMIFLTSIIISSSFLRMYMYESAYGYTISRLLVYIVLITEILLLIPTIIYILNSKINIFKYYIIIIVSIYTLLNLAPINYIIAYNNINRYYKTDKIDIYYLENRQSDNIPLLIELYENTKDQYLKETIDNYLTYTYDNSPSSWQEFNLSKEKANKELEEFYLYKHKKEKIFHLDRTGIKAL